eukprot:2383949-Pyramimonas_sp.AAC.1
MLKCTLTEHKEEVRREIQQEIAPLKSDLEQLKEVVRQQQQQEVVNAQAQKQLATVGNDGAASDAASVSTR